MTQEQKRGGCLKWGAIALGGVFVLGAIGAALGDPEPAQPDAASSGADGQPAPEAAPVNDPTISAAEFAALKTGMTYADAVAVIGGPGELISENTLGGTTTSMYQWDGEGAFGANANAMFQGDALIQKSQFGLE